MLNGDDNENGFKTNRSNQQNNNIHEKILLISDWLRKKCSSSVTRVQTCNTSAKLVTRVQITNGF